MLGSRLAWSQLTVLFCSGFLWTCLSPVLAIGGFGLDYLPATSSSSESSWHQSSAPSGTWAAQGPPAMEDSSAVLMESLKVCLTETVLRNAQGACLWGQKIQWWVLAYCRCQSSVSETKGFFCRLTYAGNVGGVTSAGRCHSFPVLAVLGYVLERDQDGRTGRNYNICFD